MFVSMNNSGGGVFLLRFFFAFTAAAACTGSGSAIAGSAIATGAGATGAGTSTLDSGSECMLFPILLCCCFGEVIAVS